MPDAPALTDEALGKQLQRLARPRYIAYLKALLTVLEAIVAGADPATAARDLVENFTDLGEGPLQ